MKNYMLVLLACALGLSPTLARAEEQASNPSPSKKLGPFSYVDNPTGAQKLLPDISLIGTFAAAAFSDDPAAPAGHDPSRTGFNLQEIEVSLQSNIDPYFRADIFLGFLETGVELEEGFVTTLGLVKGLQVRGGKFLLPFGRQNTKHLETWDFADIMLVNKYLLGPENLSELGVEVSYLLPTPFFLQVQGSFTNGDNDTSFDGKRKQDFLYQGRVTASFDPSANSTLLLGSSAATGFNASGFGNQTTLLEADLLWKWKPRENRALVWQTEYIHRWMQTPGASQDGGFYSYVDYQFAKRWHAGVRYDHMGLPAGLVAKEWRVTPALTFNPTEFSRLRAQYEYDKPVGGRAVHAGFLQLEYSMGPHGGHPF